MRFLFVVIPERGHVNPYIGPALELRSRGHRVAFYAARDIRPQLRDAGIEEFFGGEAASSEENRGRVFAERVRDRERLRGWIRSLLLDVVPSQVETLRGLIRTYRPDAVAMDSMVYAAAIAAELERVPYASLSSSLNPVTSRTLSTELTETIRWLAPSRAELFARYGVRAEFRICDAVSPYLNTVFTTRTYIEPDSPLSDVTYLVGPSIPRGPRGDECEFPWDRLKRPTVYMSLGSQIYYQPRRFQVVLDAVRGRSVQLVIAMKEYEALGELSAEVVPVRYAPQLKLLPRVDLLITHGGANSVMEALTFGIPMLVNPICNDQPIQAYCVERRGVGLCLDLETATPDEAWSAIERLLAPRSDYRGNAREVQKSYDAANGAMITAGLVEHLGATRRPIRRRSEEFVSLTTAEVERFLHEGLAE